VLDTIGGDNIDKSLEVTKTGGSIISIPTGLNEEVTAKAETLGVKGYFIMVQSDGQDMKDIASLIEQEELKPHVSKIFDFQQMPEAHIEQETGRTVGKIVIKL
jgi:NADPH:quinone reductase-like Zn-dependent oxidoreductase